VVSEERKMEQPNYRKKEQRVEYIKARCFGLLAAEAIWKGMHTYQTQIFSAWSRLGSLELVNSKEEGEGGVLYY